MTSAEVRLLLRGVSGVNDPGEHPSGLERGRSLTATPSKVAVSTGVPTASSAEEQSGGGDGEGGLGWSEPRDAKMLEMKLKKIGTSSGS